MLDRDRVIAASLELVANEGFSALGLRAVSAKLGVTPMALYRHIDSSDELEAAVLQAIIESLPLIEDRGEWSSACRAWAHRARSVLAAYPGTAAHILPRCFELKAMLVHIEALLSAALHSGRRGFEAVAAANAILMYVLMRVEAETSVRRTGSSHRALRHVRANPGSFPALSAHVAHYEVARVDEHFAYGLDIVLASMRGGKHGTRR